MLDETVFVDWCIRQGVEGNGRGLLCDIILTAFRKNWKKSRKSLVTMICLRTWFLCRNLSTAHYMWLWIMHVYWNLQPIYTAWPFTSRWQVRSITSWANLLCHGPREKLIVAHLVKIFPALCGTWRFIRIQPPAPSVTFRIMQNTAVWDVTSSGLRL